VPKTELLQGTLDLLILKILALGPNHGWGISTRIRQISRQGLDASQGSLYPALHRLEKRGWLEATWGISEANQRAKYYALTTAGRAQLVREQDRWAQLVTAIGRIMNAAPAGEK
jgi:PadR family transcriptional regulator PadR